MDGSSSEERSSKQASRCKKRTVCCLKIYRLCMVVVVLCMTMCRKKERWRPEKSQNGPCLCNKRA